MLRIEGEEILRTFLLQCEDTDFRQKSPKSHHRVVRFKRRHRSSCRHRMRRHPWQQERNTVSRYQNALFSSTELRIYDSTSWWWRSDSFAGRQRSFESPPRSGSTHWIRLRPICSEVATRMEDSWRILPPKMSPEYKCVQDEYTEVWAAIFPWVMPKWHWDQREDGTIRRKSTNHVVEHRTGYVCQNTWWRKD